MSLRFGGACRLASALMVAVGLRAQSLSITTTPSPSSVTLGNTSVTLDDNATLSGGNDPTGGILFQLVYGGTNVDTEMVTVNGDGTYSTPTGYTLPNFGATVTGTYQWNATYSGDSNNYSVADLTEQVIVTSAAPTLVTSLENPSVVLPETMLEDSAVLSGGYSPGGSIAFDLYGPGSSSTPVYTDTLDVSGNGDYATSGGYVATVPGYYTWQVSYSGDGNNSDVSASPESEVVSPEPCTLGLMGAGVGVLILRRGRPA